MIIHNGNLTIIFLNGSSAKGAFIVLEIIDNRTLNPLNFEYLPIGKSPSSNTVEVSLSNNGMIDHDSSSLMVSVYDIESNGLLKDSLPLMPAETLPWPRALNASSLIVEDNSNDGEL